MYSIVRNPLYLGNFIIWSGLALFARIWWLSLIIALVFWIYYERIIFAEEAYLRTKFGAEYLDWAERTPVFVPRFRNYQKSNLPFSLKNVLRREYNGFFAVILCLFLLETIGDLVIHRRFEPDAEWIIALCVGFVIWATLRTLKKRTGLLDVSGR